MEKITLPNGYEWVDTNDPQFVRALKLALESRDNLFIQGKAGVGKSLLIKLIASLRKNVIVLSTTGTTAMELSTESIAAQTLHSFFMLPPVPIFSENDFIRMYKTRKFLNAAEVIIIDEASMMSNYLFDTICNKIIYNRKDGQIPQLILLGDVMQLPPVIGNDPIVKAMYQKEYGGKCMFFNSHYFKNLKFRTIHLRKSFRQADQEFANRLFEIGYNDHTKETLDYFNQNVMSLPAFEKKFQQFMYMTPTNKMVDSINNAYISQLTGESMTYEAEMSSSFPASKKPSSDRIEIKIGAQVMCTTNGPDAKAGGQGYTNGMIGEVVHLEPECVTIQLANGSIRHVGKTTMNVYDIGLDENGDITYTTKDWYRQIDCKVAKGITIHKSQGKTFDAAYIALQGWVPEGLTYVALSRLKSFDGFGLSRPLKESDIKINEEAFKFLVEPPEVVRQPL